MPIPVDPDIAPPSGVTLDDLVSRVRRELNDKDNLNALSEDLDLEATSIRFSHPLEAVTRGTLLTVGNETMHVWSVDIGGKTVTVRRGYGGTDAQVHTAGSLVSAGGKSAKEITDALNDELMALSASGLFQMRSIALTLINPFALSQVIPELDRSNFYQVQHQRSALDGGWYRLPGASFSSADNAIQLNEYSGFGSLRVLYKAPFKRLVNSTDDVQSVGGLHSEAADILVYGAAYRLTASEEFKRNDFRSQGDTRRGDEVPYRALALARRDYKEIRDQRLSEERDRLRRQFPLIKAGW